MTEYPTRTTGKLLTITARYAAECDYRAKNTFMGTSLIIGHPEGWSATDVAEKLFTREYLGHGIVERMLATAVVQGRFQRVENQLTEDTVKRGPSSVEFSVYFFAGIRHENGADRIITLHDAPSEHAHVSLHCSVSDLPDTDISLDE